MAVIDDEVTAETETDTDRNAQAAGTIVDPAPEDPDSPAPTAGGSRRGTNILAGLIAVGVLAGLASWTGLLAVHRAHAADRDELRSRAVAAASADVLTILNTRPQTARADVARLLSHSSGQFASSFGAQSDTYVRTLQQAGVTSSARILSAGVQQVTGDQVVVLVTADSDTTQRPDSHQATPPPTHRDLRLRVTISRENGRYLLTDLEYEP